MYTEPMGITKCALSKTWNFQQKFKSKYWPEAKTGCTNFYPHFSAGKVKSSPLKFSILCIYICIYILECALFSITMLHYIIFDKNRTNQIKLNIYIYILERILDFSTMFIWIHASVEHAIRMNETRFNFLGKISLCILL